MRAVLALALLLEVAGEAQAAPGPAGPYLGCGRVVATNPWEICGPALAKPNAQMQKAYRTLEASESKDSFATVRAAQAAWLAYVLKNCRTRAAPPSKPGGGSGENDCLDDNFTDRAERLSSARVYRSGGLRLEPRMRLLTRARPATEESDIYPWMTGGPQAKAFNRYVAAKLELSKRRMDDKELFAFGDDVGDLSLYARRTYSVMRFDGRIVSLLVSTFDYTGGAHEALGEEALNWDLSRAKPIVLTDVFVGWTWRRFAVDYCRKDLHRQFAGRETADPDRAAIDSVVIDNGNWLWGVDRARVHFTVYTVASFADGEFDVDIPYRLLKPYLRAHAPVLH